MHIFSCSQGRSTVMYSTRCALNHNRDRAVNHCLTSASRFLIEMLRHGEQVQHFLPFLCPSTGTDGTTEAQYAGCHVSAYQIQGSTCGSICWHKQCCDILFISIFQEVDPIPKGQQRSTLNRNEHICMCNQSLHVYLCLT